jgi:hypothetical protein
MNGCRSTRTSYRAVTPFDHRGGPPHASWAAWASHSVPADEASFTAPRDANGRSRHGTKIALRWIKSRFKHITDADELTPPQLNVRLPLY